MLFFCYDNSIFFVPPSHSIDSCIRIIHTHVLYTVHVFQPPPPPPKSIQSYDNSVFFLPSSANHRVRSYNTLHTYYTILNTVHVFPTHHSQHASADVERILIGNKCDWESKRVVPKDRGAALAHNQNISFLETSAKTNFNIDETFETLAKQILKKVQSFNT